MESKTNNIIKETMRKTKALLDCIIALILFIIIVPLFIIAFMCCELVISPIARFWRDL